MSTGDHAGGGFVLAYTNSLGTPDHVEIDFAFTTRVPLAAPFECRIWQPDGVDRPLERLCAHEELIAGKLNALVDRVAALSRSAAVRSLRDSCIDCRFDSDVKWKTWGLSATNAL